MDDGATELLFTWLADMGCGLSLLMVGLECQSVVCLFVCLSAIVSLLFMSLEYKIQHGCYLL